MGSISPTALLGLAAAGVVVCWFTLLVNRIAGSKRESVLVPLLLVIWIAADAVTESIEPSIIISTFRISAFDVISVALIVIGVARLVSLDIGGPGRGLVALLLAFFTVHVVRGILDFGVKSAINDARPWFYFFAALVFAATIPMRQSRRIWIVIISSGVLLTVIAVPYLLIDGIHPATELVRRNGTLTTNRPIISTGALVILQSAILAVGLEWPSRKGAVRIAIGAGTVVLLLEHRTLWVAGLAVGAVAFFWWFRGRTEVGSSSAFGVTGLALLLLPVAVWGFTQSQALSSSASETTSSNSTFTWRTTSWEELISSHHSTSQLLFGQPSGASVARVIDGSLVMRSPHDGFVDAYLRFGGFGLAVLCALGILLWRHRAIIAAGSGLTVQAVSLVLLTQFIYCITYDLDLVQGLIDGLFISGLVAASTARAPVASSTRSLIGRKSSTLGFRQRLVER